LEIISRLWSGQPVHFQGKHYRLDGAQLTARPVQQPRIPIWVGGNLLVPAVRRRILRWDGSCAYKGTPAAPEKVTPDDVRLLLEERAGAGLGRFDIKVSGGNAAEFAAAGASWWGQWIAPGPRDEAVAILRAGPPGVS